mgnify:CR=1 FL=1
MLGVVLDLDRTLVHTTCTRKHAYTSFTVLKDSAYAHVRPYAKELLRTLAHNPGVVLMIWTAGEAEYAADVVEGLCKTCELALTDFALVLSRADTFVVPTMNAFIKDLDVVRRALHNTMPVVLVDDDPVHTYVVANQGCVMSVPPFVADDMHITDHTLLEVLVWVEAAAL